MVQCSNNWKKWKNRKLAYHSFLYLPVLDILVWFHKLSIKKSRPFRCIYVHRSCFKIHLTEQWRPERWRSYRTNLQVTLRNERVSLEMAGWNAFLLWSTHTKKLRNIIGACAYCVRFMRMFRDQIPLWPLAASFIFCCPKFNSTTLCKQPTCCLLPVLNFIEKIWGGFFLHAWPH